MNNNTNIQNSIARDVVEYYSKYRAKKTLKQSQIHGTNFNIDERYKILEKIGQGAYGVVVAAVDQAENKKKSVAIKKIEKAFEERIYTKRTLRELKLLRLLNHENVIGLDSILLPKSREEFNDIYCVSELMETDLQQIIKSEQVLTADHIKFFIYQILRGLKYVHSGGVIHRDLKPRNLLVNSNCDLKICDFGLARAIPESKANDLTDYVTTRWYRPPELLLSWTDYTAAMDVWSVGIILAELIKRKPLLPGSSSSDQLMRIFDLIGTPSPQEIAMIPYDEYRKFIKELPKRPKKPLDRLFPRAPKDALDLIDRMLTFDFQQRITVEQALQHPYLADLHLPDDEPSRQQVPFLEFEFESYPNLTRQQYKDLVYEEILLYHYPDFKKQYLFNISNQKSVMQHIFNNSNKNIIDQEFTEEDG
ncbi:protein kinase domain protein [Ichthyophthirius multifiliis]|uniref:Mitogen-activated protein kinase n=1 Tax=Ichthyophthirius multifiliis TaxID=5932 RepID=G0R6E2_ICHMU|nr:protein kinase domain protein [Ichthyophthirius multifiliis]EGR26963.1 protein kinase domain protein [Ichthyophthirius multifiliis]|eukprot:XP_004023847.1 protein kinase domain protein [Ichthyophthirius multifiliis]